MRLCGFMTEVMASRNRPICRKITKRAKTGINSAPRAGKHEPHAEGQFFKIPHTLGLVPI